MQISYRFLEPGHKWEGDDATEYPPTIDVCPRCRKAVARKIAALVESIIKAREQKNPPPDC